MVKTKKDVDKTKFKVFKVRAVPLKENESISNHFDYTLSYKTGVTCVIMDKLELSKAIKLMALGIFSKSQVSYSYKKGDNTYFEVTYTKAPNKQKQLFGFVTT